MPAAAPTIGKYTLNDPSNASTTPEGEVILVPGLPPRDPITSFIYNDAKLGAEAATAECNKMCAHLASFRSQADQHDVEAYYISTVSYTTRVQGVQMHCQPALGGCGKGCTCGCDCGCGDGCEEGT